MTYLMIAACALAALLQWRVLHDPAIAEPEHVCNLRRMRIAAHLIAAGYGIYLAGTGYWLQVPLALSVALLALVDVLAAFWRLRPDLFDHRAAASLRRARRH
ncbi:MAG: hypothetical protein AB1651_18310 [Pseudomonadota bacterium]